jgi:hypothetical protein
MNTEWVKFSRSQWVYIFYSVIIISTWQKEIEFSPGLYLLSVLWSNILISLTESEFKISQNQIEEYCHLECSAI